GEFVRVGSGEGCEEQCAEVELKQEEEG
ncbi:MAG: hypothetical protein RL215_22, partial [Planctomycetota bacterium]